ncbi:extensin-like [Cornus florida]|uniref:extensin-like n=1 Tax=Cornus florida TaxID=4283 RepID=UPI0028A26257|nr:extensin-like [Cornus florida]
MKPPLGKPPPPNQLRHDLQEHQVHQQHLRHHQPQPQPLIKQKKNKLPQQPHTLYQQKTILTRPQNQSTLSHQQPPSINNPIPNHLKPPFTPIRKQTNPPTALIQDTALKITPKKPAPPTIPKPTKPSTSTASTTLLTQVYPPPLPPSLNGKAFPSPTIKPIRSISNTITPSTSPKDHSPHSHDTTPDHLQPTSSQTQQIRNFNPLLYSSPAHQIDRLTEQLQWKDENLGKALDMFKEENKIISELREEIAQLKIQKASSINHQSYMNTISKL